jgi:diguanylate cyclase (GGDEF)-like protein/PAS domain S-box-containing protein
MTATPSILIVDDDPLSAKILHKVLDGMGNMHFATSGATALKRLSEQPIDLVLLDIVMPEMDGFATCRALRQDHPEIPVVFITATDDPASEIQALDVGGHDFITKPLNPPVVRARVALHLKLRAHNTAHRQFEDALRNTKEHLEAIISALPDLMFRIDREGTILEYHAPIIDQLYVPPSVFMGKKMTEVVPENAADSIMAALAEASIHGAHRGMVYSLPMPQSLSWYELSIAAMGEPTPAGNDFIVLIRDITTRKQMEEQLRVSEERHRLLADNAIDVIWTMDLDGRLSYVSPSVERLRGFTADEVMRQSLEEKLTLDSLAIAQDYSRRLRANVEAGLPLENFRGELEQPCKDGSTIWTDISACPLLRADGTFVEILGMTRDISERKKYEQALQQAHDALAAANAELLKIATTDPLTGARNRRHFEEATETEMQRAQRHAIPLSLLLFDIDHFKSINDRYGHLIGDQVLIEVTQRAQNHLRTLDLLARWGGEEFVVLIPHCGSTGAVSLAEKLRALIANEPFPKVGTVTASFGIAELDSDDTYDAWLRRVDEALYAAKSDGRNCVRQAR